MRSSVKEMNEREHKISVINLKRMKKRPVSLSLPIKLLQRLDKAAENLAWNRSDTVSFLLEKKLEEMISAGKKRNS